MQKVVQRFIGVTSIVTLITATVILANFAFRPASAVTTIPATMSFQGRLLDSAGAARPDGLYNMQFRIYTVESGGTAVWSETRETTNRIQVTNGLFSTQLGQVTPIPASIFASGNLFFEVTMATPATAVCSTASCASWEAAMSPRQTLASSAYAYNAETLDGLDSSSFAASSGSTNYIQNQATLTAVQPSSNLWISGTARADTSLLAPTHDTATAVAMNVGTATASSVNIGKSGGTVSIKSLTTAGVVTTTAAGQLSSSARLAIATGGTNAGTIGAAGTVAYSTGTAYAFTAAGTSGQCLQSAGTASPTWGACGSTVTVGAINGQTKSTNGAVLTGNTLYMQTADASNPGLMGTGAQVFSGDKVFRTGSTNGFEIQNSGGSSLLRADTTNNTIHVANALNIQGATATSTALQVTGNSILKATSGVGAATLFSDGFESGNTDLWTGNTNATIVSTPVGSGTKSVKIYGNNTNVRLYKDFASLPSAYTVKYKLYIAGTPVSRFPILNLYSSAQVIRFQYNGGKLTVNPSYTGADTTSTNNVFTTGAWYDMEYRVTFSGLSANIKAFVNNTSVLDFNTNVGLEDFNGIEFGQGGISLVDIFADEVSVLDDTAPPTTGGNLIVEGTTTTNATSAAYTQRLCHDQANGATTNLKLGDCASTGQADLAEFYATDGRVEPGDLVAPIATGGVMGATTKAYQSNMIGIVSTNPIADGIIGWNEKSPTRQPIALAGRVPLKVSLQNGDIRAGDPLTASSIPGVAMRATNAGRIIGYALEDYTSASLALSDWVIREEADRNKAHVGTLAPYTSRPDSWATGTGKIMVFANASYTDPSSSLQGSTAGLLTNSSGAIATAGLNVSGNATIRNLTVTDTLTTTNLIVTGHIISSGRTPTVKATTTCKLDNLTVKGNDVAGEIGFSVREGCAIDTGALSLSFASTYTKSPQVIVAGYNKASSGVRPFIENTSSKGFTVGVSERLQPGVAYRIVYHVIE